MKNIVMTGLSGSGKSTLAQALGERLLALDVREIWTGHCTGRPAFDLLVPILGDRLHYLATGTVVTLGED